MLNLIRDTESAVLAGLAWERARRPSASPRCSPAAPERPGFGDRQGGAGPLQAAGGVIGYGGDTGIIDAVNSGTADSCCWTSASPPRRSRRERLEGERQAQLARRADALWISDGLLGAQGFAGPEHRRLEGKHVPSDWVQQTSVITI